MGYVLKAVLSSAQHPEYGQITVPFPIPDEKYDRMIELLEPLEIGDALRRDCRVDELDSFYTVLNRLVGSLVNFDELDYLAKRLDSFDDGEAAQFQGMACKLGVSNIKDFINLTFCCQQATVITDFSDLDAIGRQHYMTMQGGGCRIEELERLDGRKFALDLILNHLEGRITPYGVVYDNGMKLEQLYDGRHFPCYHYQPNLLAVGLSSRQEPENTDQITWLLLPCSEQQLQRGIARSGVNIHDARIWYEDSLLPSEVEEVLEGQREDLFALNDMATAIAALSDLEQKKLTAVMEMAKPECAGEIRELAKNLELFEFAPKVRTPAEYGRYMIQDSGHYCYDLCQQEMYRQEHPVVGRVTFASGEQQEFTDSKALLQAIREELPFRSTTGFRFETLTDDPEVKKAVDDILLDFAGEDNSRRTCNYGLTETGKQALRKAADPSIPHTYAWFVMADTNTPQEIIRQDLTLEEAIQIYQDSNTSEKRLGVIKDGSRKFFPPRAQKRNRPCQKLSGTD